MQKKGLWVRLEAKPGKEQSLADFLKSALTMVMQEPFTVRWFAIQLGPSSFGIFDTFESEDGRDAHLNGQIAQALMTHAPDLLASAPVIEKTDVLAAK